jgi:hypothetical protein
LVSLDASRRAQIGGLASSIVTRQTLAVLIYPDVVFPY